MASSGAGMDGHDTVVQEGDVMIHHELDGSLHLLTFPLRPSTQAIEPPVCVRMRPNRRVIEYEYAVDTRGEHFDERARGDARLARVRLRSAEVPLKYLKMAAVMRDGSLHLTPISAQHMMRPDMGHLETGTTEMTGASSAGNNGGMAGAGAGAGASSNTPVKVQVQYKKRDVDGRADAFRRASWGFHAGQDESDNWVDLSRVKPDSGRGRAIAGMLCGGLPPSASAGSGSGSGAGGAGSAAGSTFSKRRVPAVIEDDEDEGMDDIGDPNSTSWAGGAGAGAARHGSLGPNSGAHARQVLQMLTLDANGGSNGARADGSGLSSPHGHGSSGGGGGGGGGGSSSSHMPQSSASSNSMVSASLQAASGGSAITLAALERQPVAVQVEEALRRAHVLPSLRLLEYAVSAASLDDAINVLDKMCRLVRGNWVLRSDVYYSPHWRERLKPWTTDGPGGGTGAGSSIPGPGRMSRGRGNGRPGAHKLDAHALASKAAIRDFVLCQFLFSPDATVNIDDAASACSVLPRSLMPIFTEVAVPAGEGSRYWRFKRADDADFQARFPRVADHAHRWWKRRDTELAGLFKEKADRVAAAGWNGAAPGVRGYVPSDNAERDFMRTTGLAAAPGAHLPGWLLAPGGSSSTDDLMGLSLTAIATAAAGASGAGGAGGGHSSAGGGRGRANSSASGGRGSAGGRSRKGSAGEEEVGAGEPGPAPSGRGRTPGRAGYSRSRASSVGSDMGSVRSGAAEGEVTDLHAIDSRTAAELRGKTVVEPSASHNKRKQEKAAVANSANAGGAGAGGASSAWAGVPSASPASTVPLPRSASGQDLDSTADGGRATGESASGTGTTTSAAVPGGVPTLPLVPRDADGLRVRETMGATHAAGLGDMLRDTFRRHHVVSMPRLLRRVDREKDVPLVRELYGVCDRIAREELAGEEPGPAVGKGKAEQTRVAAAVAAWSDKVSKRRSALLSAALLATMSEFAAHIPSPGPTDVFVLRATGSAQADRYRPTLLHLLAAKGAKGARKADVRDAVRASLGDDDMPGQLYQKVMKELAVAGNNVWRLKNGEEEEGAGVEGEGAGEGPA